MELLIDAYDKISESMSYLHIVAAKACLTTDEQYIAYH